LQIVAADPQFISAAEIPEGENLNPKEVCLLEQPFIKDESKTLSEVINETVARLGERVSVRRFSRFELGK
jgi:elongation factor Ts